MTTVYLKVTASELGSLLGCFSRQRQCSSIINIWKKSRLPMMSNLNRDGMQMYHAKTQLLRNLGVKDVWDNLYKQANMVCTQEQLNMLMRAAFDCLYNSNYVRLKMSEAIQYIDSPFVTFSSNFCYTIKQIISNCVQLETYQEALITLEEYNVNYDMFGLKILIDLLKMCACNMQAIRSTVNCSYGKNAEILYIKEYNQNMESGMEQFLVETKVSPIQTKLGSNWYLEGRIDGKLPDGNLVEIKHRTGKGLSQIPIYELLQVHAYMYLFNKRYIKLVQCIRRENESVSDTTIIFFNDDFWSQIMNRITKIFDFIEQLSSCDVAQECFFLLEEHQKIKLMEQHFVEVSEISFEQYQKFINP